MLLLFLDTETTGLPIRELPRNHPDQPHIVELSAQLVDDATRRTLVTFDSLVNPQWPGFEMPPEATAINHITTEMVLEAPINRFQLADLIAPLFSIADAWVAQNTEFEMNLLTTLSYRTEIVTHHHGRAYDLPHLLKHLCRIPAIDTAQLGAKVFPDIPRSIHGRGPRLTDLYERIFEKRRNVIHRAFGDMIDCRDVYFELHRRLDLNREEAKEAKGEATLGFAQPSTLNPQPSTCEQAVS